MRRIRYPDGYAFVPNGEDEAEFDEYRGKLKKAFTNITRIMSADVLGLLKTAFRDKVS